LRIIFEQLIFLYSFILLGILFGKLKKGLSSHTSLLSFLLVNLFLPAKVFNSFSKNFTIPYIRENYVILCASLVFLAVFVAIALVVAKLITRDKQKQNVYRYNFTISNYGYMDYVLAEELLGDMGLTSMILFCIPFSMYTYSFGYMLLTGSGSIKKIFNTMTASIALGCVSGLLGITLPSVVSGVVSSAAACAGPLGMLLAGIVLSEFTPKELLCDKQAYIVCTLRLAVIPLAVFGVCKLLSLDAVFPYVMLVTSMPCGLNPIIFPKLIGGDCKLGARLAFISHLLACVTLPIWLYLIV
jgi:predicted permease